MLCSTEPVFPEREPVHVSDAQVFVSGALFLWQQPSWCPRLLALVSYGACFPGSQGTITKRETIPGRLPPPKNSIDRRLKHIPSLSIENTYLFVLEITPEDRHLVWHTIMALRHTPGIEVGGNHLYALLLPYSAYHCLPERNLYHHLGPDFYNSHQMDTSRLSSFGGQ